MQTRITYFLFILTLAAGLFSCKKDDYKNDGGLHKANVNMTTYDYLKQHGSFDSLIKAIDLAGLKDAVNGNITFFAVPDWGVRAYLAIKKKEKIIQTGDENISFYMADLDANVLRDSLKLYMFPETIKRENLSITGKYYQSLMGPLAADTRLYIKLRRINNYNAYIDHVDYINFTKVVGTLDTDEPDPTAIPPEFVDESVDCQTSGIFTTTGTLHVLSNYHTLFFTKS